MQPVVSSFCNSSWLVDPLLDSRPPLLLVQLLLVRMLLLSLLQLCCVLPGDRDVIAHCQLPGSRIHLSLQQQQQQQQRRPLLLELLERPQPSTGLVLTT